MELFRLFGSVFIDNDKANQSLSKTDEKGQSVTETLGKGIVTAAKWGAAIGAAAMAGGTALFKMANSAAESTDRVDKLSQKIGISRQSFQEWDFILSQNGASVEGLQMGLKTLSKAADEAAQGVTTYTDVFDRLNVSVTDNNGKLKDQEALFNETISALSKMENETERTALASQLLGKSATELSPMLNSGAESVEELRKKAHELGLVLGDDAVNAGVKLTDTIDQAKRSFGAITAQIGVGVMPMFQNMLDWILQHMPEIRETMSTVFGAIEIVVTAVFRVFQTHLLPIFTAVFNYIYANWPIIQSVGEKVFTAIFKIVERVWDVFANYLFPVLKALYDFISPTFPLIGKIIEAAFNTVIWVVNAAISVFERALGIINSIVGAINAVRQAASRAASAVAGVFSGGGEMPIAMDDNASMQGLATGTPRVTRAGRFLVGEQGPEEVFLPAGSAVVPNGGGAPAVVFERGAFEGAYLMDDYGVDRIMDKIVGRMRGLGVNPT